MTYHNLLKYAIQLLYYILVSNRISNHTIINNDIINSILYSNITKCLSSCGDVL